MKHSNPELMKNIWDDEIQSRMDLTNKSKSNTHKPLIVRTILRFIQHEHQYIKNKI